MILSSFAHESDIRSAAELRERLLEVGEVDDIRIEVDGGFPWLEVLLNGANGYLFFVPFDGHPGFVSLAGATQIAGEIATFYMHSQTETMEVQGLSVVSRDAAIGAIEHFFKTGDRDVSFDWLEL